MRGRDQARCTEPKEQRVGNGRWMRGRHGGAGWTRTTDNAIMSRALYRLSYGTPAPGVKPTWQPALLLLAWPSSCGASRSRHAFSCSTDLLGMTPSRLTGFAAGLRSWCRRIYPALSSPPTQYSDRPPAIWGVLIAVFALCIFASAFLLFLVEPMVAKMVLPVVGGTPAVWTTSVLFFQTVLLVGYGYSHWLAMRLRWRWQALLHGVVLLLPITVLPIHIIPGWNPPTSGSPVLYLVLLLTAMVGLPFFVVSTTSPLIQHWFSRTGHPHASDPYFLYRSSNLGSALGLLSYPALIEPHLGLRGQAQAWGFGFVAFLLLVVLCLGVVAWTRSQAGSTLSAGTVAASSRPSRMEDAPLTWRRRVRWVLLAAVPSTWFFFFTDPATT